MSKQMIIYWYTTKKDFNEIKSGSTYCIGEVDPSAAKYFGMSTRNAAEARIKEELGKSAKDGARITFKDIKDIECLLVYFPNPNAKERGMDKDIHKVLDNIGCKRIATEWFDTSPDEIKRVINHIETGASLGTSWKLRKRQEEAIVKFKDAFDRNEKKFGLFAMPRFGKTIVSFDMMNYIFQKYTDKKYIFFLSAKLDAKGAVREDYYKFGESCNFKLYMYDDARQLTADELQNNKYLFFASKQWFDGKSLDEIKNKFKSVNKDDCAAVFFDEAHFARMTDRAQRTISILNPKIQIDITGTPFRLKSNEDYNDYNSYIYSVLDEAEDFEKADNKEKFRLENPELVYITPENEFFKTDSSFGEFFEGDKEKVKNQIKEWVKKTFYSGKFNIGGKNIDIQNAIIVVPPRKKYCDIFTSAVNEIARDEKLAIKCTKTSTKDKDDENYIDDNEKRFREWNEECKNDKSNFHLLVTIGKGLQAISFPDCHAVIMMSDMTNPESYIQAAFRSKTPNNIKKEAYVIDYNKGRTLQIIDTFIKNHLFVMSCDDNYKQEYNRALATIKIKDHSLTSQEYTFEEIFNTFTSNWNIEKITDSIDFDLDNLANRINLNNVNLVDLEKPHQLQLQLTDRGEEYEKDLEEEQEFFVEDDILPKKQNNHDILVYIEKLKNDLIKFGYIPFGGEEKDRLKDINYVDIQQRELPVGINGENISVWSYLGGEDIVDDIYIDESGQTNSGIRWKYVENKQFVNISGQESHGDGENNKKKILALINRIVQYLPAYFLISGQPNGFDDFSARFGKINHSEKFKERQLFREFMGMGIDHRYVLEIFKACDIGSREQIISFCNDKVDKCFNNGKLIPEKVLDLFWVYKKDGSRPVPKDLANKMRDGKNYDFVICGGYYLTDETTKMYITDSFSEAKIMQKIRPEIKTIYSTNILETLENKKGEVMKFSSFIMNPPYGKLHLPILKKMVELIIENGGNGVSLQPVRWLQDPLWKYKNNSDAIKMQSVLSGRIEKINIIDRKDATKAFGTDKDGTGFQMEIGIFVLANDGEFDYESLTMNKFGIDLLMRLKNKHKIKFVEYGDSNKQNFVPIVLMLGHVSSNGQSTCHRERYGYFAKGRTAGGGTFGDGYTFLKAKSYNLMNPNKMPVVPFDTPNEAKNFYEFIKLSAFRFFVLSTMNDTHVQWSKLPFANDYKNSWDNKRFYDYFGINNNEQKIIEKTMKLHENDKTEE